MSTHRNEFDIVTQLMNLTTEDTLSDQIDKSRRAAVTRVSVDIANLREFFSPTFYINNMPWRLCLHADGNYLDFSVNCNWEDRSEWSCRGDGEVKLLSYKHDGVPFEWKFEWDFCKHEWGWGTCELLKWEQLMDPSNDYVRNGQIVVEVHIRTLS